MVIRDGEIDNIIQDGISESDEGEGTGTGSAALDFMNVLDEHHQKRLNR